jgi:hypothetical protein
MKKATDILDRYEILCEFCKSLSYIESQEIWLALRGKRFPCWRCGALLVVHWHHTEGYAMHLVEAAKESESG